MYKESNFLTIQNLNVSIKNKDLFILNNIYLKIKKGKFHMILGPNGSGKSTLSKIIIGHPLYTIKKGKIIFKDKIINNIKPEIICFLGIFLAFQYPLDLPVNFFDYIALLFNNEKKNPNGIQDFSIWWENVKKLCYFYGFTDDYFNRNINEDFSGGERKRTEILQMLLLNPDLVILDEIDSGVDIDSLDFIMNEIKHFLTPEKSLIFITHHLNIVRYLKPDFIHIIKNGLIVQTGSFNLLEKIVSQGFTCF